MPAYEALADLYDALMDDVDYDAWAEYYLALIGRAGVSPAALCDCACGTGSMSVRFAGRGVKVTGVDISEAMLEKAQAKARQYGVRAMFVRQDMCALRLPRPVDALVCACDGVNYMLDDKCLSGFSARARDALRPGGALAFDISSPWKLKNTIGNNFFGEDRDDVTVFWANQYDARAQTVAMDLTFFVRRPDGLYRRTDESHVQKAHDPDHLCRLLAQNGFGRVTLFGDRTFDPPQADEPRIHILAVRE